MNPIEIGAVVLAWTMFVISLPFAVYAWRKAKADRWAAREKRWAQIEARRQQQ